MARTICSKCGKHHERMVYGIIDVETILSEPTTVKGWLCGPCADAREGKTLVPALVGLPSKDRYRTGWNGGVTNRAWTR